jgi:DEAD/DEAH box helicase
LDVFKFRENIARDYERFSRSFTKIGAPDIKDFVDREYAAQKFWPAPLVQLNPNFVPGGTIDELADARLLHHECRKIFRAAKTPGDAGIAMRLRKHQEDAIRVAQKKESYVLTTGTGSGKSLSYFIPIVDDVLRRRAQGDPCKGISAIVIYPMNALCNSQLEELQKFLTYGYGEGNEPVTYARYTGQESKELRQKLAERPPDILLTNYVMLELIMTRQDFPDPVVIEQAKGLRFLVLDELHTYRGRQGADVAMLVRRVRERLNPNLSVCWYVRHHGLRRLGRRQKQGRCRYRLTSVRHESRSCEYHHRGRSRRSQTIQPSSLALSLATFQAFARNSAEVIGMRGSSSWRISFAKSPGEPLRLKYVTEYLVPSRAIVMSLPDTRRSSFGSNSGITSQPQSETSECLS